MRFITLLISCLLPLLTMTVISTTAHALEIRDVRIGMHPDKVRMVIDTSNPSDYRVFMLDNPYRLVIDLPEFEWNAGALDKPVEVGITGLRHGALQPGISRIVFDMKGPHILNSAFILPQAQTNSNRLVIDFKAASVEEFSANKSKVMGTLITHGAPSTTATFTEKTPPPVSAKPKTPSVPTPPKKRQKPLIIIDPGHGGADPGAVSKSKILEKNIVLALGKELRKQLLNTGKFRVKMTRDRDVYIRLSDRVKYARNQDADLFISLHADSIRKSNVRGASFYTLSEKASDAQTAKLAARENKADLIAGLDLSVEDEQVANILVDLAVRDTTNQGKFFANMLVEQFSENGVRILENPHRHAGFAVLKAPDIPSVLVEAGFMSNRSEANLLSKPEHRRKIVSALRHSIESYFKRLEQ